MKDITQTCPQKILRLNKDDSLIEITIFYNINKFLIQIGNLI